MAKKEKLQYCLWSDNKEYLNEIMIELGKKGIDSFRQKRLGIHFLLVGKKNYNKTIAFAQENLDSKKIGVINHYGLKRHLCDHSLVYARIKDARVLETGWENERRQPRFIREMLDSLSQICECRLKLRVNACNHAIEILANGNTEDYEETRNKIINYLYENMGDMFENIYKCEDDGRLIKKDKTRKRDTIYNLFDSTFLASGMYNPDGANIVPKTDEELLTESGYKSDFTQRGCQKQKQTVVLKTAEKIVINGMAELYEIKKYHCTWDAKRETQDNILPIESSLVDNITYNASIVVDNDIAKVITHYTTDRKATMTRKLPFRVTFPNEVSVRNGLLPYPLKTGNYSGVIEEYYMRSTDRTKLLHFATHSPYFEIYDIPEGFDFVNDNSALNKASDVYDIRDYNTEEPNLQSVRNIIDNTVKQLMLSNKEKDN